MSTPDTTLEAAAARICARQQVRWAPGVTLHTCMLNAATQLSSAPRHPVPCPAVAAWHKPASYFWRSADSRPSGPVAHSATTPDPEQKRADCNRRPRLPAARPGPASADAAPNPTAPSRARGAENAGQPPRVPRQGRAPTNKATAFYSHVLFRAAIPRTAQWQGTHASATGAHSYTVPHACRPSAACARSSEAQKLCKDSAGMPDEICLGRRPSTRAGAPSASAHTPASHHHL